MAAGHRARVRGLRGQGRSQRVRGRSDEAMAEGEAEGLDDRRRSMDSTDQQEAMSERLLLDFDAFFLEHRRCGDLDGGVSSERVWLACVACGARIERPVETGF